MEFVFFILKVRNKFKINLYILSEEKKKLRLNIEPRKENRSLLQCDGNGGDAYVLVGLLFFSDDNHGYSVSLQFSRLF